FQEPLADGDENDDSPDEATRETSVQRSALLGFSDLSRSAVVAFRKDWQAMPDDERLALIEALVDFAEQSIEVNFNRVFREALNDEIPRIRKLAIDGLWEDDAIDLLPVLLSMLRTDSDIDVRAEAAGALVRFTSNDSALRASGAEELVGALLDVANDEQDNALVRRRVIETLGPLADDGRVELLLRRSYADDDQAIVCGAIAAMGFSGQSRWIPEIERAIASDDAELRFAAAIAAGSIGDSDLVQSLASLVDDDDGEVRYAAIGSLGHIGGQGALRVLRNLRERNGESDEVIEAAFEEALLLTDPLAN
ncbi:MAG: HEAT repeat domain-containing protein, partial [Thermomicrobiales bacterium]